METFPGEGVIKEENFPNSGKPSHRGICGEFQNLRGQHNRVGGNPQNTHLTATASREVAQTLESATSKRGLDSEAQAA